MKLSCKEASRLLSAGMDTKLGLGSRIALRLHLFACDACKRVKAQMDLLRRAMADYPRMPVAEPQPGGNDAPQERP